MNIELEKLIDMSLADGKISVKEMQVILNKADRLGITGDEVEIIIESKKVKTKKSISQRKLPSDTSVKKVNLSENKRTVGTLFEESLDNTIYYIIIIKPIWYLFKAVFSVIIFLFKQLDR
jgi:hypothetical protein